jgi:hypothetical protein
VRPTEGLLSVPLLELRLSARGSTRQIEWGAGVGSLERTTRAALAVDARPACVQLRGQARRHYRPASAVQGALPAQCRRQRSGSCTCGCRAPSRTSCCLPCAPRLACCCRRHGWRCTWQWRLRWDVSAGGRGRGGEEAKCRLQLCMHKHSQAISALLGPCIAHAALRWARTCIGTARPGSRLVTDASCRAPCRSALSPKLLVRCTCKPRPFAVKRGGRGVVAGGGAQAQRGGWEWDVAHCRACVQHVHPPLHMLPLHWDLVLLRFWSQHRAGRSRRPAWTWRSAPWLNGGACRVGGNNCGPLPTRPRRSHRQEARTVTETALQPTLQAPRRRQSRAA